MDECIISFSLSFNLFQIFIKIVFFSSNMQFLKKNHLITFPLILIHYTTLIPHFFILDVKFFFKYFIHHATSPPPIFIHCQCWLAQLVAPSCLQVGPWIFISATWANHMEQRGMIGWTKLLGGMVGPWSFPKLANCPRQLGPTIWLCMMEWTNGC